MVATTGDAGEPALNGVLDYLDSQDFPVSHFKFLQRPLPSIEIRTPAPLSSPELRAPWKPSQRGADTAQPPAWPKTQRGQEDPNSIRFCLKGVFKMPRRFSSRLWAHRQRPVQTHQPALSTNAQPRVLWLDRGPSVTQRSSALDKKSFSTHSVAAVPIRTGRMGTPFTTTAALLIEVGRR